jgi:hypothetical protein
MNTTQSYPIQQTVSLKSKPWSRLRALWRADFFSPKDFIVRAVVITVLFSIAHLAGLKEFTGILNGTAGSLELGWKTSTFLGLFYIVGYLSFVLLVPTFLLGAALLSFWRRIQGSAVAKSGSLAPEVHDKLG